MRLLAPALFLAALGCSPAPTAKVAKLAPPPTGNPPVNVKALQSEDPIVKATNSFGYKLFLAIPEKGNLMISPLSISMALRMTMNGADNQTLTDMSKALGFEGIDLAQINANSAAVQAALSTDPDTAISVANSIWSRKGFTFEPSFLDLVANSYHAKVSDLDFTDPGAAKVINGWVNDTTKGKIPSIVPDPLPSDVVMYLINGVYFKSKWQDPFETANTSTEPFSLFDGTKVDVSMMHQHTMGSLTLDGGRTGITMPYTNGTFEMVAILPAEKETTRDVISAMEKTNLLENAKPVMGPVNLSFPKFKVQYDGSLNKPLTGLGMGVAFTGGADFSKMRPQKDVSISEVKHKTFIDVTEEGTEAAAVTSVEMRATAVLAKPIDLKFNRPFVYVIRHRESGQVLFLGTLENPKG